MKPEMMYLVWAVALAVVQMLVAVSGATLQVGLPMLASNRDNMPRLTGWVGRAERAHYNMLESLPLFATVVLICALTNKFNATTLLGAQLFFWARLAYAAVYLAGIPWLRTGIWGVSLAGLIVVFSQLL
jgi:uncharacterized MAPEG superfamily protein